MSVRPIGRVLAMLIVAGLAAFVVPGAASAARVELPDVVVTVAFDHPSYNGAGPVTLTFTFTNKGSVTAHDVRVSGGDSEGVTFTDAAPQHFDLAAGATHTATLSGAIDDGGVSIGEGIYGLEYESDEADANPADNFAIARARVIGAVGDTRGVVFDDAGPPPPDQRGVACVTLVLANKFAPNVEVARATTDGTGSFHLTGLPVGEYVVTLVLPTGYKAKFDSTFDTQIVSFQVLEQSIELVRTDGPVQCPSSAPTSAPPTGGAAAPVLPITGSATLRIGAAGVGTLVLGIVLVLVFRRRRTA